MEPSLTALMVQAEVGLVQNIAPMSLSPAGRSYTGDQGSAACVVVATFHTNPAAMPTWQFSWQFKPALFTAEFSTRTSTSEASPFHFCGVSPGSVW